MAKLNWDNVGERLFEAGVKNVVLYPSENGTYPTGVPWNGVTAVNENPSGAEANPIYADDIKYLNLVSNEDFGCTIEAYTFPDEFAECDGSKAFMPGVYVGQQTRKAFGLAYKTAIGNDVDDVDHGYKLHLVYGCKAAPSSRDHTTMNESREAMTFSWEVTTTPIELGEGFKPTAHIEISSLDFPAGEGGAKNAKLQKLEDALFGSDSPNGTAYLPLPAELKTLLA